MIADMLGLTLDDSLSARQLAAFPSGEPIAGDAG